MKIQQLNEQIYISDQIKVSDMNTLKNMGIKSIINNRPDNEDKSQPLSHDLFQSATDINLDYQYLPVMPSTFSNETIAKLTKMLDIMEKPIVMFCRTGNRSTNLWALSQVDVYGQQYVLDKTKRLGFDTSFVLNN